MLLAAGDEVGSRRAKDDEVVSCSQGQASLECGRALSGANGERKGLCGFLRSQRPNVRGFAPPAKDKGFAEKSSQRTKTIKYTENSGS